EDSRGRGKLSGQRHLRGRCGDGGTPVSIGGPEVWRVSLPIGGRTPHSSSITCRGRDSHARATGHSQSLRATFRNTGGRRSLSRLNHGQPGVQAHPEIVQGTTELHHQVTDTLLPQAHPVFHNATPFDAAVDMLNPEPPLVERLVVARSCSRVSSAPRGFFVG